MNEFPEGHVKVPSWEFVHFAHCCTFLNGHSFLKHFISYFTRWQETAFHTASIRKQVLEPKPSASTFLCTKQKRQRHSDGNLLPLQCLCFFVFCNLAWKTVPLKRLRADQELLAMCRRTALKNMVRKIIQPWWMRKQIALTVARLPSWGLRCCRPKEPLSEPRRGEFRRRAAKRRANRTGNAACQEIVFAFIMASYFTYKFS